MGERRQTGCEIYRVSCNILNRAIVTGSIPGKSKATLDDALANYRAAIFKCDISGVPQLPVGVKGGSDIVDFYAGFFLTPFVGVAKLYRSYGDHTPQFMLIVEGIDDTPLDVVNGFMDINNLESELLPEDHFIMRGQERKLIAREEALGPVEKNHVSGVYEQKLLLPEWVAKQRYAVPISRGGSDIVEIASLETGVQYQVFSLRVKFSLPASHHFRANRIGRTLLRKNAPRGTAHIGGYRLVTSVGDDGSLQHTVTGKAVVKEIEKLTTADRLRPFFK